MRIFCSCAIAGTFRQKAHSCAPDPPPTVSDDNQEIINIWINRASFGSDATPVTKEVPSGALDARKEALITELDVTGKGGGLPLYLVIDLLTRNEQKLADAFLSLIEEEITLPPPGDAWVVIHRLSTDLDGVAALVAYKLQVSGMHVSLSHTREGNIKGTAPEGSTIILLSDVLKDFSPEIDKLKKHYADSNIALFAIAVDTQEPGLHGGSAVDELTKKTDVPVRALFTIKEIEERQGLLPDKPSTELPEAPHNVLRQDEVAPVTEAPVPITNEPARLTKERVDDKNEAVSIVKEGVPVTEDAALTTNERIPDTKESARPLDKSISLNPIQKTVLNFVREKRDVTTNDVAEEIKKTYGYAHVVL